MYRVLFICPIPPYKWSDRKSTFRNIREVYDKMFSEKEKDYFTLLTTDYRDSFPFDLETLAHFYRSSRIFVHTSNKERQGRVFGYAWASGMPMVGLNCIGTPLPNEFKVKPYFYEAKDYSEFPRLIIEAVESTKKEVPEKHGTSKVLKLFSDRDSRENLRENLKSIFTSKYLTFGNGEEFFENLGLRIARHHIMRKGNVLMPIDVLVNMLNEKVNTLEKIQGEKDPEVALAELFPTQIKRFNFFSK
jgi:glycosyltransferase involved in cell wall biosynthesis